MDQASPPQAQHGLGRACALCYSTRGGPALSFSPFKIWVRLGLSGRDIVTKFGSGRNK